MLDAQLDFYFHNEQQLSLLIINIKILIFLPRSCTLTILALLWSFPLSSLFFITLFYYIVSSSGLLSNILLPLPPLYISTITGIDTDFI
jgi:hypothetical protein